MGLFITIFCVSTIVYWLRYKLITSTINGRTSYKHCVLVFIYFCTWGIANYNDELLLTHGIIWSKNYDGHVYNTCLFVNYKQLSSSLNAALCFWPHTNVITHSIRFSLYVLVYSRILHGLLCKNESLETVILPFIF